MSCDSVFSSCDVATCSPQANCTMFAWGAKPTLHAGFRHFLETDNFQLFQHEVDNVDFMLCELWGHLRCHRARAGDTRTPEQTQLACRSAPVVQVPPPTCFPSSRAVDLQQV